MDKTLIRVCLALACLTLNLSLLESQVIYTDISNAQQIIGSYGSGSGHSGGGLSFVDFNKDGWDDLTFATEAGDSLLFFVNEEGNFRKIPSLVEHTDESKQVLWVDFDNDGDYDLYVSNYLGVNRLYQNKGNLKLVDITEQVGLPLINDPSHSACFGDYNNDGNLDIYVSNFAFSDGITNFLYTNNGDGTFSDVTLEANAGAGLSPTYQSSFIDYDMDGLQDIYVANDKNEYANTMLRNNGDGTFKDVSELTISNILMNAMNVEFADVDGDNDFDIFITNTRNDGHRLLLNTDVTGKVVMRKNISVALGVNIFEIDGTEFNNGIYFVQISSKLNQSTLKLIKN